MPSDIDDLSEHIINVELDYVTGSAESWDAAVAQRAALKSTISGYLSTNVGQMNILLNTSFGVDVSANFCPPFKLEEKAILVQIYLRDYYTKESRKSAVSIAGATTVSSTSATSTLGGEWTSLQEGDTVIKRSASTATPAQSLEATKILKGQAQDSAEKLKQLIHSYNMYQAAPLQVAGDEAALTPTGTY
jgi:hypothetical protein